MDRRKIFGSGAMKKVSKSFDVDASGLFSTRGGAVAHLLVCGHIVINRKAEKRTSSICTICTERQPKAKEVTLEEVVKRFGVEKVLDVLIKQEKRSRQAKKAISARWSKRRAVKNGVEPHEVDGHSGATDEASP
jgi:hypothetical protein